MLFSLIIGVILLIISAGFFYYWGISPDIAMCSTSSHINQSIIHSSLLVGGAIFLILGVVILYNVFRPRTGCWGEFVQDIEEEEKKKNAKSKHKLPNKK